MKLSKSKLALAKVINENGGWLIGGDFNFVTSSHSGAVKFFHQMPRRDGANWVGGSRWLYWVDSDEQLPKWHKTILNREEYYQAYQKADADGWIEWNGGECPVDGDSIVDVEFNAGHTVSGAAKGLSWHHEWEYSNIIKYRLHKPEVKPEFCESVTRSIPEPESIDGLCAKVTEANKHQHVDAKPTIEQLAQDYRKKLDFANSKQKEADEAKAAADAALGELERAGEALGLLIGIAKPDQEPELVITDWRDLQVNDVVFVGECDGYESGEYVVAWLEDSDYDGDFAVIVVGIDGIERCMDTAMEWRFIRRP